MYEDQTRKKSKVHIYTHKTTYIIRLKKIKIIPWKLLFIELIVLTILTKTLVVFVKCWRSYIKFSWMWNINKKLYYSYNNFLNNYNLSFIFTSIWMFFHFISFFFLFHNLIYYIFYFFSFLFIFLSFVSYFIRKRNRWLWLANFLQHFFYNNFFLSLNVTSLTSCFSHNFFLSLYSDCKKNQEFIGTKNILNFRN